MGFIGAMGGVVEYQKERDANKDGSLDGAWMGGLWNNRKRGNQQRWGFMLDGAWMGGLWNTRKRENQQGGLDGAWRGLWNTRKRGMPTKMGV